jgi:hypothetical protein
MNEIATPELQRHANRFVRVAKVMSDKFDLAVYGILVSTLDGAPLLKPL